MNNRGKAATIFLIILLILFSFAALGAAAYLWFSYEEEKTTNRGLSEQLTAFSKDKDKIQRLLDTANKDKILLEKKVNGHDAALARLNEKLTSESEAKLTLRKEREGLISKMMQVKSENDNFKKQLEEKLKEIAELETNLGEMMAQYDTVRQSTSDVSNASTDTQRIPSSQEELETIIVSPTTVLERSEGDDVLESAGKSTKTTGDAIDVAGLGAEADHTFSASVLSVSREHAFLVIDAGKKEGVKIGDVFDVFHDDTFIGKVQVGQVRDTLGSANFLDNFKANLASKKDIVKRTK